MAHGSSTQTVTLVDQWGNPIDSNPIGGVYAMNVSDIRTRRLLESILVELMKLNAHFGAASDYLTASVSRGGGSGISERGAGSAGA